MPPASAELSSLLAACRGRHAALLTLLEELVVDNSYTGNREGGRRVADRLQRALDGVVDLSVTRHESARFAPHLCARSAAAASTAEGCVALVGHLDTVFPPRTFTGFRREGDLARGPGVLDMKGGLAVVVHALGVLGQAGLLARLPVRLVVVSDEEVGSPEGTALLEAELAGAACALVFEAGRTHDAIITARKGTGALTVTSRSAATPREQAASEAIYNLSRFINRAQALTDYDRGVTVSAGVVRGGVEPATATSAARTDAEATFDLRFCTTADGDALVADLHRLAGELAEPEPPRRAAPAELVLDGGVKRPPLERTDANVALYREYAACARAAGLGDGEAPLIGGGSDASTTAALGIPSIDGLGPRGAGFHTHEEYIEVPTLFARLEALVRMLHGRRSWGKL